MFGLFKKKQKNNNTELVSAEPAELTIPFYEVPATVDIDEKRLIPITDSRVLSMLSNIAPNMMQVVQSAKIAKEAKDTADTISGAGKLYRVIIPKGAKLFDSKAMMGAKRAGFIDAAGNLGQANLVLANGPDNALQSVATNQVVSSAFNVASMVVGQYYMTQINGELDKISQSVDKISTFQNSEYLSKITATIKQIKEISDFQSLSLSNEELRLEEKRKLNSLKEKCTELLDQANHSINSLVNTSTTDCKEYLERTTEIETWYKYQLILLELLHQICSLIQVFSLGLEPEEKAFSTLRQCRDESEAICGILSAYHKEKQEMFEINISDKTIGNPKWLQTIVGAIGKDDWKQRKLPEADFEKISLQMKPFSFDFTTSLPEYNEDVVLIAKDGEIYYLPNT